MRRFLVPLLVAAIALTAGLATTFLTFMTSERNVAIGAHTARVSPTLDSFATFDFGPLLPAVRFDLEDSRAGIGVFVDVRDTATADLEDALMQNAVIASQPAGEIDKIEGVVRSMLIESSWRGLGVGLLTGLVFGAGAVFVGRERWRALADGAAEHKWRTGGLAAGSVAVVVLAGLLINAPNQASRVPTYDDAEWVPLTTAFPDIPRDIPELDRIEVPRNAATRAGSAIVDGVLSTYRTSVEFYGDLRDVALEAEVRTPEEGETTALVVTDRHNNIGMDPVAEAIAQRAEASYVFNLGDDTSTGGAWEEFSVDSLASTFEDYEVFGVAGNHDTGEFFKDAMRDRGVTMLDGEPLDVDDLRLFGDSDPRSSGLTAGYDGTEEDSISAIREQDARLTAEACEDGEIDTVLVHAQSSARELADSGCVRLILSGHLHRQVGPEVVGDSTVTLTTASTGGAVYAFALGSKLRRDAQVTIVTYREGRSVGLQSVDFTTGGGVVVQDYIDLDELFAEAAAEAEEDDEEPEEDE